MSVPFLGNVGSFYFYRKLISKINNHDFSRAGGLLLGYIAIEYSFLKLEYKSYSKNTHPVYTAYSIKLPEQFKPYWKKSLRYATLNRRK